MLFYTSLYNPGEEKRGPEQEPLSSRTCSAAQEKPAQLSPGESAARSAGVAWIPWILVADSGYGYVFGTVYMYKTQRAINHLIIKFSNFYLFIHLAILYIHQPSKFFRLRISWPGFRIAEILMWIHGHVCKTVYMYM